MKERSKEVRKMSECKLCGKNDENLTLLSADHKDLGQIMVCSQCWKKLWNENRMVCGTTGSGGVIRVQEWFKDTPIIVNPSGCWHVWDVEVISL